MMINLTGPGAMLDQPEIIRDPYDISTWGPECGRGVKSTGGRKHRGSASDDFAKQEDRDAG